MKKLDELTQIFYEISMSIGMSLDLNRMLREVALVALRKLNGTAIAFFAQRQEEERHFECIFITPKGFLKCDEYVALEQILPSSFNPEESEEFYKKLPLKMAVEDGKCLHLMSLPGYGLIAFFRAHGFLPEHVISSFAPINKKLAVACQACRSHRQLDWLLKLRTGELEAIKEAEIALLESEEKFRSLVEASSDMIWEVDGSGCYTYVSPNIQHILGYDQEEVIGKSPFDIMPKDEAKRILEKFKEIALKSLPIESLENRHLHKNGQIVVMETSGVPIIGPDGELKGYRGIDRDITQRRETEKALKIREETLNSIFLSAPVGIGMVVDRTIMWVNNRLCSMNGYTDDELIHQSTRILYPSQEDFERVGHEIYSQIAEKGTGFLETRWKKKNGTVIDVLLSATPLEQNDWSKGVTFTGLDISERRWAEDALRKSEEMMRNSQSVAQICSYSTNLDVNEIEKSAWVCSPEFYNIFGIDETYPHTIEGWANFIHPDYREEVFAYHEMVVKEKKTFSRDYKIIRISDGEERWVHGTGKLVFDKKGNPVRMHGAIQDITERKRVDNELKIHREHLEDLVKDRTAELEAKNKEMETFTYSVSHDLKAPLRGIDGYSRLLEEEYSDRLDEEGLLFLKNVRQSTIQMNQLIEDLLSYSRLERRDIQPVTVDLQSMIDSLISQRTHELETRKIQLSVHLPFKEVTSDIETLRQVITNYIDNAMKFSSPDEAATIEIGGQEKDASWTVWVKDNGIGFDPQYEDRIFEIFQRLHRAEDFPGTGIGLAIVRKAVERIDGRAWAESSLGKGATFYIEIPKKVKNTRGEIE